MQFRSPVVLMRSPRTGPADNEFEQTVAALCAVLGVPVDVYRPEPGGRDQVFHRDIGMVGDADVVLCVFPPDQPMDGGTGHVVEKAQDRGVPVYAYTDAGDGRWTRLGEWDPEDAWSSVVPAG